MNRCIVFAHYDIDGIIDDHVIYFLKSLRPHTAKLIFVSTSATDEQLEKLERICDTAMTRENCGYDFISWKTGIEQIDAPSDFDEILFINDSIYGPLYDLKDLFFKTDSLAGDFWGLTRSQEVKPHIQSFFFAFRRSLINNGLFDKFWQQVTPLKNKRDIIKRYEIGMTEFIEHNGGICTQLFDLQKPSLWQSIKAARTNGGRADRSYRSNIRRYWKKKAINPMHFYWRSVIEAGVPFVKVELLRDNPCQLPLPRIYDYLKKSSYAPSLIDNHLKRVRRQGA
jgi:rhamnosyltransferase